MDRCAGIYQNELAATEEPNLTVLLTAREKPAQLMSASPLQSRLLDALMACLNGVMRMSDAIRA